MESQRQERPNGKKEPSLIRSSSKWPAAPGLSDWSVTPVGHSCRRIWRHSFTCRCNPAGLVARAGKIPLRLLLPQSSEEDLPLGLGFSNCCFVQVCSMGLIFFWKKCFEMQMCQLQSVQPSCKSPSCCRRDSSKYTVVTKSSRQTKTKTLTKHNMPIAILSWRAKSLPWK